MKNINQQSIMKIAFFTDSFYPRKCGVTTYLTSTIKRLRELKHEVMIVAPKHKNGPNEQELNKLFNIQSTLLPSMSSIIYPDFKIGTPTPNSLLKIRHFQPDIIHFHTPGTVGFEAVLTAKILKKPLIATFHTYFMEPEGFKIMGLNPQGKTAEVLNKALWGFAARFHNPAQIIIAPTKYVALDLKKRWKNKNIVTIPGGVDLSLFQDRSRRKTLRKKFQLENNFTVLTVGRLAHEKNLHVLIEGFSIFHQQCPNSRLLIIGDGPIKINLEFYSQALGLENSVIFAGAIPYQKLSTDNYYSLADVFVSASTWDTQGLSVVEAMSSGLPLVVPKIKAMPEITQGASILVKPNDPQSIGNALKKLANNTILRKKLSAKAKEVSKNFSIKTSTDRLLLLYQEVLAENKN